MIEFRDVAVCYSPSDRHPINALEGINLKVAVGEWMFVVGPSGAGKSTLLKLIYGDARAAKGQVLVEGRDVTQMTAHQIPLLRRGIGVIFQDFQLLAQKTVWENVAFALQVIGAPQKRLVRDVPRALDTVGLNHRADARPHQLSGGERQRVAIARAIVNNPRLLLADEPTGNLDPQTGWDIIEVLDRINAAGTTVVMATHDRAVVNRLQRRVVRLAEGRVFSDDARGVYHSADDVLRQPATQHTDTPQRSISTTSQSTAAVPTASQSTADAVAPLQSTVITPAPPIPAAPSALQNAANTSGMPADEVRLEPSQLAAPRRDAYRDEPSIEPSPSVVPARPIAAPWLDEPADVESTPISTPPPVPISSPRQTAPRRPRIEDEGESLFETQRRNQAPLGSPENPLVQFEPPPSHPPRRESK